MFFCGQRMYICYLFSQGYTYCAKGGWSVGCTSFFHIVKRYTRPLACGLLERRRKKSDWWWWWWGKNIFLLNQSVRFLTTFSLLPYAEQDGRALFLGEKVLDVSQNFPFFSFTKNFIGFVYWKEVDNWNCCVFRVHHRWRFIEKCRIFRISWHNTRIHCQTFKVHIIFFFKDRR